ncbi:MAG: four helix bundle protein [Candidatus Paceibacterota bacterium]
MKKFNPSMPPPNISLPIVQSLVVAYKIWHEYLLKLPKTTRYTLGTKIDNIFATTIENIFIASLKDRSQKLGYLTTASDRLDLLKFFLQIAWEIKALDNKKYITLSKKLNEIGKMLGGWQKQTKTPQRSF